MSNTLVQLQALVEAGKTVTSTLDVNEVLSRILELVSRLFPPADWSLILVDRERGDLYFEIAVGQAADALLGKRIGWGEGIAGWVAQSQRPAVVADVATDPRFARRFDAMSAFSTRSILAAPMVFNGETLGLIELVSEAGAEPYTFDQLSLLTPFADLAAVALANARNFERVAELTVKDDCTDLFNARHLHRVLDHEVKRNLRYGRPLSMIFFDMDHFKQVNDTHGHLIGSQLLREVGEVLLGSLRDVDVAVRYGGDEFVVLLPETHPEGARIVAIRLWLQIRERAFLASEGLDLHLTASMGCASLPHDAKDARALLQVADEAMYAAKHGGRDCLVIAGEGQLSSNNEPLIADVVAAC